MEHGFFGRGYCNDLKTIKYLSNLLKEKQTLPDFVRKSWKTINKLR